MRGAGPGCHPAAPQYRYRSSPDQHAVRADNRDRRPGRRYSQRRPAQALSGARQVGPHGLHYGQRDLRSARNGDRLFRRYRERNPEHRSRTGLTGHGLAHRYCRPMTTASLALPTLVGLIALALAFDFLNGLHDAANSIATVVSTRVLRPLTAVFWAAFFNFIALGVFGLHVAQTLGTGIIDPGAVDAGVIFGALVGAIVWNITSWLLAFPTSSSHALIGGLLGAGVAHAGLSAVVWSGVIKTAFGIVLAPLCGFAMAVALVIAVSWLSVRSLPFAVDRRFRYLQLLSAALYSLGHGGNDAQKTMGVIAILLYSGGHLSGGFNVPLWVILSCQAAMALGTLCGGWRIVRTMGSRITHLTPMQGWCAETGGAATLFTATWLGVPVSTTHTITGGIIGVGAVRRLSAVRWGVAGDIVIAWLVTMPAAAIVGALFYLLTRLLG